MKNSEDTSKQEKRFRRVKLVLDILFLFIMVSLLALFEEVWSMNKVWMQLIFVAVYAIIWSKASEFILSVIQNRILNKTDN